MAEPIYHLLPYGTWQAVPPGGSYAPESLESDGFVHFSGDEVTLLAVANAFYREATGPMVVLQVDPGCLTAEVRWEAATGPLKHGRPADVRFPHVYGPVEHSAGIGVRHVRRDPDRRYRAVVDRPATAQALDLVPLLPTTAVSVRQGPPLSVEGGRTGTCCRYRPSCAAPCTTARRPYIRSRR